MDYVDPPLVIIRDREVGHGLVDTGTGQLRLGNIDLPANTTESFSHQSTVVILGNVGKILNTRLWARYKWLGEFYKATADHGFRVGAVWHRFNQVAMRGVGNVKNIPNGYIPWFVELVNIWILDVPEAASIEACAVDFDQLDKYSRVSKVEFL